LKESKAGDVAAAGGAAEEDGTNVTDSSADGMKTALSEHLGAGYLLLGYVQRMQMRLLVFVRCAHRPLCSSGERATENTGLGHVVANKGGQARRRRRRRAPLLLPR